VGTGVAAASKPVELFVPTSLRWAVDRSGSLAGLVDRQCAETRPRPSSALPVEEGPHALARLAAREAAREAVDPALHRVA